MIVVPLSRVADRFSVRLPVEARRPGIELFLKVISVESHRRIKTIMATSKVSGPARLEHLAQFALPGIPLEAQPGPPRALRGRRSKGDYFRLKIGLGNEWSEHVVPADELCVLIPNAPQDMKLSLVVSENTSSTGRLYVGNLPSSFDEVRLRKLFEDLNLEVCEVRLVLDHDTGAPRGFGFVELSNQEQALVAIRMLNGRDVLGNPITVNGAMERAAPGGGFGRRYRISDPAKSGRPEACAAQTTVASDRITSESEVPRERVNIRYRGAAPPRPEEARDDPVEPRALCNTTTPRRLSDWIVSLVRGKSPRRLDVVHSSIYAPTSIRAGKSIVVQIFVHLLEASVEVSRLATQVDPGARRRAGRRLEDRVARGARLDFVLRLGGLRVDEPFQSIVWQGQPESREFIVSAPHDVELGSLPATVLVSREGVPIGVIKFVLEVTDVEDAARAQPGGPVGEARRFRDVFVSYAKADRTAVLARVQALRIAGIRVFQDLLSLDPGERWERELYRHIDTCDAFLLFWSASARSSEWVKREWRYAIQTRGEDVIVPVLIEGPPVPEPPVELRYLHFDDRLLYFMSAG